MQVEYAKFGRLFAVLLLLQTFVPQGADAKPVAGKKSLLGGIAIGGIAGVAAGHLVNRRFNQEEKPNSVTLPNGCQKQTLREPDPQDPHKFIETERLVCQSDPVYPQMQPPVQQQQPPVQQQQPIATQHQPAPMQPYPYHPMQYQYPAGYQYPQNWHPQYLPPQAGAYPAPPFGQPAEQQQPPSPPQTQYVPPGAAQPPASAPPQSPSSQPTENQSNQLPAGQPAGPPAGAPAGQPDSYASLIQRLNELNKSEGQQIPADGQQPAQAAQPPPPPPNAGINDALLQIQRPDSQQQEQQHVPQSPPQPAPEQAAPQPEQPAAPQAHPMPAHPPAQPPVLPPQQTQPPQVIGQHPAVAPPAIVGGTPLQPAQFPHFPQPHQPHQPIQPVQSGPIPQPNQPAQPATPSQGTSQVIVLSKKTGYFGKSSANKMIQINIFMMMMTAFFLIWF